MRGNLCVFHVKRGNSPIHLLRKCAAESTASMNCAVRFHVKQRKLAPIWAGKNRSAAKRRPYVSGWITRPLSSLG